MDYFDHLIGQEKVKKKLNHYIRVFENNQSCPFLLFNGQKGIGKTEFARAFALQIKKIDQRKAIELNCGGIKNVDVFFEAIYTNEIRDKKVVVFFDEAHELPQCLTNAFLTIFNSDNATKKDFRYKDEVYPFDFLRQSFLFATTESDKLFPPFKDRLTGIEFTQYSSNELCGIIKKCKLKVPIDDQVVFRLSKLSRGSARTACKLAKEIQGFCQVNNHKVFGSKEYEDFVDILGYNQYGLTNIEKQILETLAECKAPITLRALASRIGLSSTAVSKDHELYLLRNKLINIDGKRSITINGRQVLEMSI